MSTIIKRSDLDLVIENTLKEAGLVAENTTEEEETDIVNESVNTLVDELNKENTITEGLSKELDEFKRFTNYKL